MTKVTTSAFDIQMKVEAHHARIELMNTVHRASLRHKLGIKADQSPPGTPAPVQVPDILKPIANDIQTGLNSLVQGATAAVTNAANNAAPTKDESDFDKQMDAQEATAQQQADQLVQQAYARAKQIGDNHPEVQSLIIAGMSTLRDLVAKILGLLIDAVAAIIDKFLTLLETGVEALLAFVNDKLGDVANWLQTALPAKV